MKLSIVIPCYNEESGIDHLDQKLSPVLEKLRQNWDLELIFVDDGSTDNTKKLLEEHFGRREVVKIIEHGVNKNLGAAMRTGFAHSTGDVVVTMDSDCTYNPEQIFDLLELLKENVSMVTASPYHPHGTVEDVPGYRLFLSRSINLIYSLITGTRIYTYTALFRAYKKEVIENVTFKSNDFLATAEMLICALKKGYAVIEYPTTLHVRKHGISKMKLLKVIKSHFKFASSLLFLKLFKRKGQFINE